jgi:alkylation response protein AidB-like acyl-CoA dehydrogenase
MSAELVTALPKSGAERAWEKVRSLRPVIEAHRAEGDELRRLPPAVAEAFLAADIYRVMVPTEFGGLGIDPLTLFDLIEEIASYDGSTGWNFAIGSGGSVFCSDMSIENLTKFFSEPHCNLAASGAPPGRAVAVEGGYRVTGRWTWGSAIHQARYVGGIAFIYDGEAPRKGPNGAPVVRFFMMPQKDVEILDTWFAGGMRATGSTDWTVTDLFVPEDLALKVYPGASVHPAPIYRVPGTYFGFNLCPVSLGVARSAIQGLKALGRREGSALKTYPFAQYAVAKAEALYDASVLSVRESFRVIWNKVVAGTPIVIEEKARCRRAVVHAVEASVEAVNLVCEAAGGASIMDAQPFARALRDVHATHAHLVLSRKFMELAGQVAFGIEFSNPIF